MYVCTGWNESRCTCFVGFLREENVLLFLHFILKCCFGCHTKKNLREISISIRKMSHCRVAKYSFSLWKNFFLPVQMFPLGWDKREILFPSCSASSYSFLLQYYYMSDANRQIRGIIYCTAIKCKRGKYKL